MAEKSAGKEFLRLAIEIERNGYNFYESVAQDKSKEVQDIIDMITNEEKIHFGELMYLASNMRSG